MNNSLKRIQAWRSRRAQGREQRALDWWVRERADGKARFVIRSALTYSLTIVGVTDILGNLFSRTDPLLLVKGVLFTLSASLVGLHTWSDMESKYKKALDEGLKAPSGKISPHDSPSQITRLQGDSTGHTR